VAAVDVLKDGGMSLADALALVSEATGRALDQTQLGDLRENLRRTKKRSEAREKYDQAKKGFTGFRRDYAEAPDSTWRDAVLAVVQKR
jgi:type II secretory pathway component PulF